MPKIVEGYRVPVNGAGSTGATSWIDGLRTDMRRQMVRELALRRIHSGTGSASAAAKQPGRFERFVEGVIVGVGVAIASAWICSRIGLEKRKERS